jgi:hypothetical protein
MLNYEGFVKKNIFVWVIMGEGKIIRRSFKTTGNQNCFQTRPKVFYLFKSYMTTFYLPKIVFPKFDPLTVTGLALCVDLGPNCQNFFCVV